MKVELLVAWVNKLRSGEFTQVRRILNNGRNGRCVLGVLHEATGEMWNHVGDRKWIKKVGLSDHMVNKMVDMNDNTRNKNDMDFFDLADWIEEHKDSFVKRNYE